MGVLFLGLPTQPYPATTHGWAAVTHTRTIQPRRHWKMTERQIFYVAMPVGRRDDGKVLTDSAEECASAEAAIRRAEQMAAMPGYIGALAFARTFYPDIRKYDPIDMLGRFGEC